MNEVGVKVENGRVQQQIFVLPNVISHLFWCSSEFHVDLCMCPKLTNHKNFPQPKLRLIVKELAAHVCYCNSGVSQSIGNILMSVSAVDTRKPISGYSLPFWKIITPSLYIHVHVKLVMPMHELMLQQSLPHTWSTIPTQQASVQCRLEQHTYYLPIDMTCCGDNANIHYLVLQLSGWFKIHTPVHMLMQRLNTRKHKNFYNPKPLNSESVWSNILRTIDHKLLQSQTAEFSCVSAATFSGQLTTVLNFDSLLRLPCTKSTPV